MKNREFAETNKEFLSACKEVRILIYTKISNHQSDKPANGGDKKVLYGKWLTIE